MVRSLHEKVLTPSLNFRDPNPNVDWDRSPFRVNTELREWPTPPCGVRRGGVSAFGFGGTNFHVVVEEHVPGRYKPARRVFAAAPASSVAEQPVPTTATDHSRAPLRGALVLGGRDDAQVVAQLQQALAEAKAGRTPAPARPGPEVGAAAVSYTHLDVYKRQTIARDRWQLHLKTNGAYYRDRAAALATLHRSRPDVGADAAALAMQALSAVLEACRQARLTRSQHVLFRLGELICQAESAEAFAQRAAATG